MRFTIPFIALIATITLAANAAPPTVLSVSFGGSVPKDTSGMTMVEKSGPSRANGGEHILVHLDALKTISDIKLTAYSTGHAGKVLVHSATATNGSSTVSLDGLFQFAKMTTGDGVNYQNLVMLPDTKFVEVAPNQAFSTIDIAVEGFTNNDVSLSLQITSNDGLAPAEYLITRTGDNETVGSYVNEAGYAKFTPAQVKTLLTVAAVPAPADLVGKTYTCTVYSRLNPTQVDSKTRTFSSPAAGILQSTSTAQGEVLTWAPAAQGIEASIPDQNGCGKFNTINVLRRTAAGNLISEVVLDLNAYVQLCTSAGYDPAGVQAVESNSTFPSILIPNYVVDTYEFCKAEN